MSWKFSMEQPKPGTETALEACDYFVDEVIEASSIRDAREEVRQIKHGELRTAVSAGDERTVRVLLAALGTERQIIVNMAPSGANTLLFIACQSGYESITQRLLDAGADGRSHAVTKYSPLYAAVHSGHLGIARLMLDRFPELIQQPTVERWLPLHAACINGHIKLLELLISYSYPDYLYQTYREEEGQWEWRLPFDANAHDVTGQTSLYIASILGNKQLVGVLLKWQLQCRRTMGDSASSVSTPITPTRKRISFGIQAIMSKLHISGESEGPDDQAAQESNECQRCPINVNLLCGAARETALLAAVRGGHLDVVQSLLQHGANPNIVAKPVEDHNDPKCCEEIYGLSNVPIAEACKQRSLAMLDLLLKHGARDDNGSAIGMAMTGGDEAILSRLLARRVHPDSDYKINKKGLPTPVEVNVFLPSTSNISYSAMFPNVPTIIDWHSMGSSVQLSVVRVPWMVSGVLLLNPKLQSHPRLNEVALTAITRIDFSHNVLTAIPQELFHLVSLKYLNVAQNKITDLPAPLGKSYGCPVLDELFLQDNQLTTLPAAIFHLPALSILDVSNNKLQQLPFDLWRAPKLRELNVAFNLLRDLPVPPMQTSSSLLSLDKLQLQPFEEPQSNKPRNVSQQRLTHRNLWSSSLDITDNDMKWQHEQDFGDGKTPGVGSSQLSSLNIANNLFTSIPAALPCLAVNLTRLNMSYNSLRSMGHVTSYPATLKQLDLSHNEISCWPSLPRITESDPHLLCYSCVQLPEGREEEQAYKTNSSKGSSSSSTSFRASVLKSVCRHRRHLRLEALRTLILADNLLTRIQLSTDDATTVFNESEDADWSVVGVNRSKVIFPNLSMLDMTNNCLKEIPASLHELSSLSVLNISGNVNITELPPHLGLLSRLWNLNTRGCLLQEPLRSMIESKKHKTMDIVGYLKSIYEDAQPYARMKLMVVGVAGIGKSTLLDLLRQGAGSGSSSSSHRSRASENHWAKRMGHARSTSRTHRHSSASSANISTVGVDIGTWICEKRKRAPGSHGPVVFRTWDFGGQKEYYATHQYFLSKRSLYLVLWRISDGHKGLAELLQWLGNIQARAPNSPVIIVGTHFDAVGESISPQKAEQLQQLIREKFIAIPDAEKIGLPRVIDSIEISCRTLHNIHLLANIIYDTSMQLRSPGSKEPMLLQKIPASYIALEDIVNVIACNLRAAGRDPVLDGEQYRRLVTEQMRLHNYKSFRDAAELQQATTWCHENGVLLHYDDATLRDYYFLDPQWLCDMLAHVVTVREINPFAPTGVMKLDDLQLLFRSAQVQGNGNRSYIVSLLNKFEVALTWDSRTLLIPSLLPLQEAATPNSGSTVKLSQRSRGRSLGCSVSQEVNLNNLIYEQRSAHTSPSSSVTASQGLRRILLMTYFPSGFWSRLITRILADEQIIEAIRGSYVALQDKYVDFDLRTSLEQDTQWNLWQTGLALYYGHILIFKIWEVPFQSTERTQPFRTNGNRFKLKLDGIWSDVNLSSSSILEVYFPLHDVNISQEVDNRERQLLAELQPHMSQVAKLLALTVDHIDLLLEDWYPSLGTRFVHTSEGRFLITRLVLCPRCLWKLQLQHSNEPADRDLPAMGCNRPSRSSRRGAGAYFLHGVGDPGEDGALNVFSAYLNATARRERRSEDSLNAGSDADSGVGPDSAGSSRNTSVDGHPGYHLPDNSNVCYAWMIEECILSVYNQSKISCPVHLEQSMAQLAPDVIFADIPDKHTIPSECIIKGSLLGRGAFGFVFKANCKVRGARSFKPVAMKMLQPVPPGARAKESALMAFKVAVGKWDRDPLQHSCKAYCTARQELAVLLTLKHPNIVPLVGICIKPLALVLELAPLGGLDVLLRQYRRSGAHMGPHTFQTLVLQAARAIEYLHRRRIIYRDLKSENVLVWELPQPHTEDSPRNHVHIKIADYGISRQTAPSGAKGFGGTEGFMAPEIIRYNGEEEYTEKVDCFSFGMFIYENISLRQPFEGHESIKECILEGSRPALTQRETQFPTCCLDLMVLCWHEQPRRRPTASQIVSILSAPECIHLLDVVAMPHSEKIVCGVFQSMVGAGDEERCGLELWLPSFGSRIDILDCTPSGSLLQCNSISCSPQPQVAPPKTPENGAHSRARSAQRLPKMNMLCCCLVGDAIWMGDVSGNLHAYSTSSYAHLFSYMLDPAIKSAVISLVYMERIARVAVGTHNGRVFLVDATQVPSNCAFAEGSFVLTEICSGFVLHAACSVFVDGNYELWCGEIAGKINVFPLNETGVSGHQALCHSEEPNLIEDVKVARMCSNDSHVFSCLYPGCMVYQWGVVSKRIENKLDCSKLLPCSESLQSIAIDEHVNLIKCQISALAAHNTELYIGTTWGCLIVAELHTLRPISVFRPYENEIKSIITLSNDNVPLIATIGRRYRSLISRYVDSAETSSMCSAVSTPTHGAAKLVPPADVDNHIHCLLWRAKHWT
ncbi:leucine-rich repeat serine/threonine-protein kinase 1 isoform X1 [Drosophila subpulchrella]|uniref:leucine-rich repeat serine/threonine-protein kinase 1 isoform X1 n=1 Tax=Drosophila subpulchrella TaxID=1486046 RepID=UPI0018A14ABF|nr:leucine-rich repeat serine/threonine-protein kinase 1 isoform X1 [Drosophila subpulchrella]XP_037707528.1 leucine-rich repeat serine/threonine-protein kinase 1 isoform X1 [Drosophila subpulchrella]